MQDLELGVWMVENPSQLGGKSDVPNVVSYDNIVTATAAPVVLFAVHDACSAEKPPP